MAFLKMVRRWLLGFVAGRAIGGRSMATHEGRAQCSVCHGADARVRYDSRRGAKPLFACQSEGCQSAAQRWISLSLGKRKLIIVESPNGFHVGGRPRLVP